MHLNASSSANSLQSSKGGDVTSNTELRHLPLWALNALGRILDSSKDMWEQFAAVIPNLDRDGEPLLSYDNIRILENQWNQPSSSAGIAVLRHWSHTGRKRPTVGDLLDVFIKIRFLRAADFVSQELLKGESVSDVSHVSKDTFSDTSICTELSSVNISTADVSSHQEVSSLENKEGISCNSQMEGGNSLSFSESENENKESLSQEANNSNNNVQPHHSPVNVKQCPEKKVMEKKEAVHEPSYHQTIPHFRYKDLYIVTRQFNLFPYNQGGSKLGEGAFGEVYLGRFRNGQAAIKRLKGSASKQFEVELKVLTKYKHENLLPLIGYSSDGPAPCLIYEYIENGSLQQHLDWKRSAPRIKPLTWTSRLKIAFGIAKGIVHLHTFTEPPLVHRDIKSANILLDNQLIPKVADFGLARIGESGLSTTITVTHTISGTSVYMAQEAFRGDVSVKLDTYSYGVVLLELLTGLYPYDPSREERDLVSHMQSNCKNIMDMVEKAAGKWDKGKAKEFYRIANTCIEGRKKLRPTLESLIPDLKALQN